MVVRQLSELDLVVDPLPDLHERMAALRPVSRVTSVRFLGEPAWLLTRHADVTAAFEDEVAFPSAAAYSIFAAPVMGRTVQVMGGEEHRTHRALVSPAFRPSVIRKTIEPLVHTLAEELAAELANGLAGGPSGGRGGPSGEPVDLVERFTARLPFLVIARLLGLPSVATEDLRRWAGALFNHSLDPAGAAAGAAEFTGFLTDTLARRRARPGADLLSHLATVEVAGDDGRTHRLDDEEIFSFIRLLFPAGADTTYRALGSMLLLLLSHDGAWERVRDDPGSRPGAVEEALRMEPPVAVQPRRSVRPTTWGDVVIPADQWVLFGIAAANRDPEVFAEPDRFDLDRFRLPPGSGTRAARPAPRPILTFGAGPHFCLGAHLARAEMAATLEALTSRWPDLTLADHQSPLRPTGAILRGPGSLPGHLSGRPVARRPRTC